MKSEIEKHPDFPEKDKRDVGIRTARATTDALLSLVPGGGFLSQGVQEVFDAAIGLPLEKRREEWFRSLAIHIDDLRQRVNDLDPARLGEDPEFVSIVAEASQIAMKTHHEEKREALRNVVMNAAVGFKLDDILRGSFMRYVDAFSVLHLKVLKLLADPQSSPEMVAKASGMMMGSVDPVLKAALPELDQQPDLLDRILADLGREGLVQGGGLKTTMTGESLLAKRSTPFGDAFLKFISEPPAPG
jgi:hypothetical protein